MAFEKLKQRIAEKKFEADVQRLSMKLWRQTARLENRNKELNKPKVKLSWVYRRERSLDANQISGLRVELSASIKEQKELFQKITENIEALEDYYNQIKDRNLENIFSEQVKNVDTYFKTGKSFLKNILDILEKEEPIVAGNKPDWIKQLMSDFIKEKKIYLEIRKSKQEWIEDFSKIMTNLKKMPLTDKEIEKYSRPENLMKFVTGLMFILTAFIVYLIMTTDFSPDKRGIENFLKMAQATGISSLMVIFSTLLAMYGRDVMKRTDYFAKLSNALEKGL